VGCGARRPAGARGPTLVKDGPVCAVIDYTTFLDPTKKFQHVCRFANESLSEIVSDVDFSVCGSD